MALLDGFKLIPLKEKIDDPYMTITEKAIKLNQAAIKQLGMPGHIQFLLNEKRLQIAIIAAAADSDESIELHLDENVKEKPIYIKEPMILKAVQKLIAIEKDGQKLSQTIKGLAYPDELTIIFDLSEAVEAVVKPRGRRKKE